MCVDMCRYVVYMCICVDMRICVDMCKYVYMCVVGPGNAGEFPNGLHRKSFHAPLAVTVSTFLCKRKMYLEGIEPMQKTCACAAAQRVP